MSFPWKAVLKVAIKLGAVGWAKKKAKVLIKKVLRKAEEKIQTIEDGVVEPLVLDPSEHRTLQHKVHVVVTNSRAVNQ